MPQSKRDKLIDTALRLFVREGFHATGIDRVLAESGVAKMTLYNHFRSKEELILAVLRRRDEQFRNWFVRRVESLTETPRNRLLACFDALGEWFRQKDFHGCSFINASAEFGERDHPIHAAAAEHKRLVRGYIRSLAVDAEVEDPGGLADRLMLLIEGATVLAHVCGDLDAARSARESAGILIEAAGGSEG
jgi:AcrR family transcriptional regulator